MIGIGIMIFFGSGLLWCVSGAIDCKQVHNTERCVSMNSVIDRYAPIGIVIGIAMLPLSWLIFSPSDDKPKSENRSPIT